jgi:hypothetical protein
MSIPEQITELQINTYDVEHLPLTPNLAGDQLQEAFDALNKEVVIPKVNAIIASLGADFILKTVLQATTDGDSGADNIGATPPYEGGPDTTQEYLEALLDFISNRWIPFAPTVTYSSVDDPTGVVTIAGDYTANFKAGTRLKMTNGGNVIYGIVSKDSTYSAPNTTVTFLHEIDPTDSQAKYLLANSAITSVYYAPIKSTPTGFPVDPAKWQIKVAITTTSTTNTPTQNTWYNVTNISLPIGLWNVKWDALLLVVTSATQTQARMLATLSTANNSESDKDMTALVGINCASTTITLFGQCAKTKKYSVAAKTAMYLNVSTILTNAASISLGGGTATTLLIADCDLL